MRYSQKDIQKKQEHIISLSGLEKRRLRRAFGYAGAVVGIVLLFACVLGVSETIHALTQSKPEVEELDLLSDGTASVMYDIAGKETQRLSFSDLDREYVEIDEISQAVCNAFVAAQDSYFYQHHGVDMAGILQVAYDELFDGTDDDQESSTITLQLVENQLTETKKKTSVMERLSARIAQQLLAVDLENQYSKQQILEYYLNTISLGDGVIGVQAASQRYFDKDVQDLSVSEAAVLAAASDDPAKYEPAGHQENNLEQRKVVLKNMLDDGYINEEEYEEALGDDVYLRVQNVKSSKLNQKNQFNSYYTDAVEAQVITDLQEKLGYTQTQAYNALYRGGLKIYTCQDSSLQEICDEVINDDAYYPNTTKSYLTYSLETIQDGVTREYSEIDMYNYILKKKNKKIPFYYYDMDDAREYITYFRKKMLQKGARLVSESFELVKSPQASFVLLEQSTGRVKAIVGGRGQRIANRAVNRATEAKKQPGDVFGVLSSYLPALDTAGMTMGTVLQNAEGEEVPLRDALVSSDHFLAIQTLKDVSIQTGYEYLKRLGFSTIVSRRKDESGEIITDKQEGLASGSLADGVTNLELTAAYAAIANKGVYQEPRFYTKVVDENGKVLLNNAVSSTRVMKESTAALLTDALEEVVETGTEQGASFSTINVAQAGKESLGGKESDSWFEGYTPYYTAGIWVEKSSKTTEKNQTYLLKMWKEIMERIHQKKKLKRGQFRIADGMRRYEICTKCGGLAIDGVCDDVNGVDDTRAEYFAENTQPTEKCSCHFSYRVCKKSNQLAGENCPKEDVVTKVFEYTQADRAAKKENTALQESCSVHAEDD